MLTRRLRYWLRSATRRRQLRDEMENHIAETAADLEAQGLEPARARTEARRRFGSRARVDEESREVWAVVWVDQFLRDSRHALRAIRRNPGFAAVAIVTLALGIGANSAIFSVVDAVFLNPLPAIPEPARLATIYTSDYSSTPYGSSSYPDYIDMRDGLDAFDAIAATDGTGPLDLDSSERLGGLAVTANYFEVVGLAAAEGRFFRPADEGVGDTVVISHALWRRAFAGGPEVVGQTIRLNDRPYEVIGVAPEGFAGASLGAPTDVWVPLSRNPSVEERSQRGLRLLGRLTDGVTLTQAQAELAVMADDLARRYPESNMGTLQLPDRPRPMMAVPFIDDVTGNRDGRGSAAQLASVLSGVVGIVLLIACANVASLLVARAHQRERDTAIRLAVGATRVRIVVRILVESVTLALLGGVAGLLVASWLKDMVRAFGTFAAFGNVDVQLDLRVLTFTIAVSVVSGLLFGTAPAWGALRRDRTPALGNPEAPRRLRRVSLANGLVVAQVSLSLLLVVAAGLFVQSLIRTQQIDTGFDLERGVLFPVGLGELVSSPAAGRALFEEIDRRVEAVVGQGSAAFSSMVPLSGGGSRTGISVDGYTPRSGEDMEINRNSVGTDYFDVMGIDIVAGRAFNTTDSPAITEGGSPVFPAGAPRVAIVNEEMAGRYWPDRNPLGQRFSVVGQEVEVVGVARNGKYRELDEDRLAFFYLPLNNASTNANLIVRTADDGASMVPTVRQIVAEVDDRIPLFDVGTIERHLADTLATERANAWLFTSFGVLATLLAALGVYGVMWYLVEQRVREMAIRIAVGAAARDILAMVFRHGLMLAVTGVLIGMAFSVATTSRLSGLLSVEPTGILTLVGLGILQIFVLLLACYVPARRATRVDPLVALRSE